MIEVKITKLMYSWTKYGGGRKGLVTQDREEFNYCQCCGDKIPQDYPMFKYELLPNEFIRICPNCWIIAKDIPREFDKVKNKVDNLK